MLVFGIATAWPCLAWPAQYQIDPTHSSVHFRIRHLVSYVRGTVRAFGGEIHFDPEDPVHASTAVTLDPASIDTGVLRRDEHLRSPAFFDVANYPLIEFKSTSVSDVRPDGMRVHGILSLLGIERPLVLEVVFLGIAEDPWGKRRIGFTAHTSLSREAFGMDWNEPLSTGQPLLGDTVELIIEVEAIEVSALEAEKG
jgi:polyisoprenoid-binding protein YceI